MERNVDELRTMGGRNGRGLLVVICLILGALGGLVAARWIWPGGDIKSAPILRDEDERPPIIVQGGSARLSIEYASETPGKEGKGTWVQDGQSGNWKHDHPGEPPQSLRISVFNAKAPCADYEDLRKAKSLEVTLTDKANAANSWRFQIKLLNDFVHVLTNKNQLSTTPEEAYTVLVVEALTAATFVSQIEAKDGAKGKCEFNADSRPVIRVMQKTY